MRQNVPLENRHTVSRAAPASARTGFTLIELLVTVAIISVLAIVVAVVINVPEMLRQSRDSSRLTDMKSLNGVVMLYLNELPNGFTGSSSTIYVSLPDKTLSGNQTSTCASLGLPTPPTGYTYQCSSPQSFRHVDGTGWVPINFSQLSSSAPISLLPVDPVNQLSTDLYYTYAANGSSYVFMALPESQKYAGLAAQDGGIDPALFEAGSGISYLSDLGRGLVGYWPLDEGTGTTAYDVSGNGNVGTLVNGPSWTGGKVGNGALLFNASSSQYVNVSATSSLNSSGFAGLTVSGWVNFQTVTTGGALVMKNSDYGMRLNTSGITPYFTTSVNGWASKAAYSYSFNAGVWYFTAFTYASGTETVFLNGNPVLVSHAYSGSLSGGSGSLQISDVVWDPSFINGTLDDVRVYNRALSAAEIATLYNAEK